jgi:3-deoxy-7-phosphoheptulonate synthase
MNYKILKRLSVLDNDELSTLSRSAIQKIIYHRQEIKDILAGKNSRLILIIGPCSAWPQSSVLEYARRLLNLSQQVDDVIKIIMRVYTQKPRSTKGWVGTIHQPNPFSVPDIEEGFKYSYKMLANVAEMGLPIAAEAVFTNYRNGFIELLSWIAIGARSSENHEHRIFASSINTPVGLKNPTSGCPLIGVNSVVAAQHQHTSIIDRQQVETYGNPYAHLVLRGGNNAPNYSLSHLKIVRDSMLLHNLKNPSVIIDASHDNSIVNGQKNYRIQPDIIFETINNIQTNRELRELVKGFMVESFIKPGNQKIDGLKPADIDYEGLSITDSCLGWEETEDFIKKLALQLRNY